MSLFASKYKPITLKALFHQDAVTSIKKWVKELVSQKTNYRKILYIYGPVGCGKTTMINTIFKNFNLIDINSDELRSSDKIKDLVTCTLSNTHFKQQSFISTKPGKGTLPTNAGRDKGTGNQNILLVDNIELCEKTIKQFTELVTDYINIPIILLSNRKINIQTTKTLDITSLELQQVTRVELEILLQTISKKEKLNFTKLEINNIIEKSIFDLRQVFCILDQLSVSYKPINELLNDMDQKYTDIDIHEKMNHLFYADQPDYNMVTSEPQLISNYIFQNYIESIDMAKTDKDVLDNIIKTTDCITFGDNLNYSIFTSQNWDLYNAYTDVSCIHPLYYIRKYTCNATNVHTFKPFKEVSCNYMNSYRELKDHIKSPLFNEIETFNMIIYLLCQYIDKLNCYFDKHKKGKNTSKQEKLNLYQNMVDPIYIEYVDKLSNIVFDYKLYTILDENKITADNNIINNIEYIDIKILKRCINIIKIDENVKLNKFIKPPTENVIKIKLFEKINNVQKERKMNAHKLIRYDIENLEVEFDSLFIKKTTNNG
jgi:hypothetical protein